MSDKWNDKNRLKRNVETEMSYGQRAWKRKQKKTTYQEYRPQKEEERR